LRRATYFPKLGTRSSQEIAGHGSWIVALGSDELLGAIRADDGAARHEVTPLYNGVPDSRDRRFIEALPEWVLSRS
jgi:hypothetical protein